MVSMSVNVVTAGDLMSSIGKVLLQVCYGEKPVMMFFAVLLMSCGAPENLHLPPVLPLCFDCRVGSRAVPPVCWAFGEQVWHGTSREDDSQAGCGPAWGFDRRLTWQLRGAWGDEGAAEGALPGNVGSEKGQTEELCLVMLAVLEARWCC